MVRISLIPTHFTSILYYYFYLFPLFPLNVLQRLLVRNGQRCTVPVTSENFSYVNEEGTVGPITISSTVILDVPVVSVIGGITIQSGASLYFNWQQNISLTTPYILVQGSFYIGTEACPFANLANITLVNDTNAADVVVDGMTVGRKFIAVSSGGQIEIHGAKGRSSMHSWTRLSDTAVVGSNILKLADPVASSDSLGWKLGDLILVTSTDYSPVQTEVFRIASIINNSTIQVSASLQYMHFGQWTAGVDQRAEVGLLSRNIFISGSLQGTLGGHMIFLKGSTVHVEGAELYNMGQDKIGRYPLHFHMAGVMPPNTYLRYNSIRETNFRCVTVHGSHNVIVDSNVAYDALGHCFYLEDGVEQNNTFSNNLAVWVQPKLTGERIGSDGTDGITAFWITNPNNTYINNVAAGCYGTGFWILTRSGPHGLASKDPQYASVVPRDTPLLKMYGNRVHSSENGLQCEATNFDANDNPATIGAGTSSWEPKLPNGTYVASVFENFTMYKIRFRGIWCRLPNAIVRGGSYSDIFDAIELATSGTHAPTPSVQYVEDALIVGFSTNPGTQESNQNWQQWDSIRKISSSKQGDGLVGWKVYDGPQIVRRNIFRNFYNVAGDNRVHSAIGVRRANQGQVAPTNQAYQNTFDNVDRRFYLLDVTEDGGKITNTRDVDGSLSGFSNSVVLPPTGYFVAPNCVTSNLYGAVCPNKYVSIELLDMNAIAGNGITLIRNEHTGTNHNASALNLKGFADGNQWRYQPLVSVGASYLVSFANTVSPNLAFQMTNAEIGESVSFAIAYPAGTTITNVYQGYGAGIGKSTVPSTTGATILTADTSRTSANVMNGVTYYWDSSRSLLFFTVKQRNARTTTGDFCPDVGCDFIWVQASVGAGARPDATAAAYSGDSIQVTSGAWLGQKLNPSATTGTSQTTGTTGTTGSVGTTGTSQNAGTTGTIMGTTGTTGSVGTTGTTGSKSASYMTLLPNGQVQYSISYPTKRAYCEVFSTRNGVQFLATNIVTGETANSDGTFTYTYTASGFKTGDSVSCRFYSYDAAGVPLFTPGPSATVWISTTYQ